LLIVAGSGTGKTAVITNRIAWLVEKKKTKPEQILAMTFTDKASQEMSERVNSLISQSYADLWVSTFHSFGERVLKEEGLDIGLPSDFKLVDQTGAWLLVRQNLDRFQLDYYRSLGNPNKFIHALVEHFGRCKDQQVSPEDYLKHARSLKEDRKRTEEVARAYRVYQELLLENSVLDFGDLLVYCLKLFQKRPLILERYRQRFKYILVDEFQDTNLVQYDLVKLLAFPSNNLTVCADSNQAIYRWRGASYGNIIRFKEDFPRAKEIFLEENYRSLQDILDLAHRFISLAEPGQKRLKALRKGKGTVEHLHFKTLEQEVNGVISRIVSLAKADKEASLSDFAILVRTNSEALPFAKALERSNIPYQFLALRGLYSKPVILDIVSYFKFLDNYHESSAAYRLLAMPFLGVSNDDIARITQHSQKRSQSVFETLQDLPRVAGLSEKGIKAVNKILALVKKHTLLASQKNVSEILLCFLEDSGYLEYLVKKNAREELDFISQFHDRLKKFEETHLDCRLRSFMPEFSLEQESGEEGKLSFDVEQGPDVVKIMTVHAAKGLEFKYVFLVNLVDRRFPSLEKRDPIELPSELVKDIVSAGDYHLQEERRLFYVALTRARDGLFLTSAEDYGGLSRKRLSRFLLELGYDSSVFRVQNGGLRVQAVKKERLKRTLLPETFSFTQLAAFEKCPLQYKFAHVLKIPVSGRPAFSFGKSIHNALFEFVRAWTQKKLSWKSLLDIYEKEWLDEWYESREQKEEYFVLGKKILKAFYQDFAKKSPQVLFLNGRPALEQDFSLKIGGHTLRGKIDRLDVLEQGVEIIDYKTGAVKTSLRPEDKKQLLIYQLAVEEVLGLKPVKLTYYYLDQGKSLSFLGTAKDKEKEKENVVETIEKIKRSNFPSTPGWQCEWCDFKNICEHARRKGTS